MEGQKALGLNLKYLKLCSKDEHEGELLMTSFSFLGEWVIFYGGWVKCKPMNAHWLSDVVLKW